MCIIIIIIYLQLIKHFNLYAMIDDLLNLCHHKFTNGYR
jgi:hypothetical protein